MQLKDYKLKFVADDAAPGWDAIDNALQKHYPNQSPLHWGTKLNCELGGNMPLDGISAYKKSVGDNDHLHFCSYGLTSLYYDEDAVGGDYSQFGFELTFRLATAHTHSGKSDCDPKWVCSLMQSLARYVFRSGKWFSEYQWLPTNGPILVKADGGAATDKVGLVFVKDIDLEPMDTPHGKVEFIQMFGITQKEIELLKRGDVSCQEWVAEHRVHNPYLITDLDSRNMYEL